jgi:hypothetical protein
METLTAFGVVVIGVLGFIYVRRRGARKRQEQA